MTNKQEAAGNAVKERPILFSAPMVRALLDGSKTQTRRIMKPQPEPIPDNPSDHWWPCKAFQSMLRVSEVRAPGAEGMAGDACPYGGEGDRLWVRETFCLDDNGHEEWPIFRADGAELPTRPATRSSARWTPSIHMPRWASRILLEITSVRVERLQDISEADAIAEGCKNSLHLPGGRFANENFAHLWWSINGDGSWEANPWVWVVEFKRVAP